MTKKILLIVLLALALNMAMPDKARANIVSDPVAEASLASVVGSLAADIVYWGQQAYQWYVANVSSAITSGAQIAGQRLLAENTKRTAQGIVDGQVQAQIAGAAGEIGADAYLGENSNVCQSARIGQEMSRGEYAAAGAANFFAKYSAGTGAGASADSSSPAYVMTEVNDLCQLGFLSPGRYGTLVDSSHLNCATPTDPKYYDADTNISSILDTLQFPMPAGGHVHLTKDHHIVFSDIAAANNGDASHSAAGTVDFAEAIPGLGSELDFAAAWKFCEHLRGDAITPTHNSGTPTIADVASIKSDRQTMSLRGMAEKQCWKALAYRTACPLSTSSDLQEASGGSDCHTRQVAVCMRLKASRDDGGYGITMQLSNPVYKAALENCDGTNGGKNLGMSLAMADAIIAHRCEDDNYMKNLINNTGGSFPQVEHISEFECSEAVDRYNAKMDNEAQALLNSLQNLIAVRSVGGASSGTRGMK